jgi:photosystem II stability/assembly factor-like uncharacterized protein
MNLLSLNKRLKAALNTTLGLVVSASVASFGLAAATPAKAMDPYEFATPSHMTTKALLLDVVQTGNRLVAVGEYGHVIISDNQGESWVQAETVPTRNTLTSVIFLDNQTGYAVGHEATILKTSDGGNTWELQFNERRGETPLFGIYFSDAKNGIAIGGFSYAFETKDGGETWTQRSLVEDSYDDFHLNDLFTDTKGNVYIPAEYGTVYKSVDRGRTWQTLETGYDGSFWGGLGLANGNVLVYGMRGNAYMSTNNGKGWKKVTTNADQSITGGTQLADGRIVLTGLSGTVLTSKDGGKTFASVSRTDRLSFATAAAGKNNTVLLFGDPGVKSHALQ